MDSALDERVAVLAELPAFALVAPVRGDEGPERGVAAIVVAAPHVVLDTAQTAVAHLVGDPQRRRLLARAARALCRRQQFAGAQRDGFVDLRPRARVGPRLRRS